MEYLKPEGFQRASDEESAAPQSSGEPIAKSIRALEGGRFMEEPSRAERMGLTDSDNEQDPEDFQQASEEETAAAATAAAAEHSQDDRTPELASQELPADKTMIYAIVNEFLGKITFKNPEAEKFLRTALEDESCLTPCMHQRVKEVFSPIFFDYTNGLKDRSVWTPRDTGAYICRWYKLASMRTRLTTDAAATEHGKHLSRDQVSQIFAMYLEDFKSDLRPEQRNKTWTYYKSCAESKMRREAGSTFVANAIWAIGLPRLPSFATEQRGQRLSAADLEAIPEAIRRVLDWLDRLACALQRHQTTKEYQDAVRRSGVAHRESGLTAAEQETRAATRKSKADIRLARDLERRWNNGTLTASNLQRWQYELLRAYWNGVLQQRLKEQSGQGSADPMCRTPLQPGQL